MARTDDNVGLGKMLLSGELVQLEPGTTVSVEDTTLLGKVRVRVRGQTESLWIFSAWLK